MSLCTPLTCTKISLSILDGASRLRFALTINPACSWENTRSEGVLAAGIANMDLASMERREFAVVSTTTTARHRRDRRQYADRWSAAAVSDLRRRTDYFCRRREKLGGAPASAQHGSLLLSAQGLYISWWMYERVKPGSDQTDCPRTVRFPVHICRTGPSDRSADSQRTVRGPTDRSDGPVRWFWTCSKTLVGPGPVRDLSVVCEPRTDRSAVRRGGANIKRRSWAYRDIITHQKVYHKLTFLSSK